MPTIIKLMNEKVSFLKTQNFIVSFVVKKVTLSRLSLKESPLFNLYFNLLHQRFHLFIYKQAQATIVF